MTNNEKKLLLYFIDEAVTSLGYNGCNDVPEEAFSGWTKEERQQLAKEYHIYNGDPEEYLPERTHVPDFALFAFLGDKLKKAYLCPPSNPNFAQENLH